MNGRGGGRGCKKAVEVEGYCSGRKYIEGGGGKEEAEVKRRRIRIELKGGSRGKEAEQGGLRKWTEGRRGEGCGGEGRRRSELGAGDGM